MLAILDKERVVANLRGELPRDAITRKHHEKGRKLQKKAQSITVRLVVSCPRWSRRTIPSLKCWTVHFRQFSAFFVISNCWDVPSGS
jgi:hypothetical protein